MQSPAATGTTPKELADLMARFLMSTMKSAQPQIFQVVEDLGLSMTQFKILHLLDGADHELTPSELAQFIGLSPAATRRAVDALVRTDIVTRRDDDADRRVKRLALTPRGTAAVGRIAEARIEAMSGVLSKLDPGQRDALAAALAPLLPDSPPDLPCGPPHAEERP